jgi:hypothetical protein
MQDGVDGWMSECGCGWDVHLKVCWSVTSKPRLKSIRCAFISHLHSKDFTDSITYAI